LYSPTLPSYAAIPGCVRTATVSPNPYPGPGAKFGP
jgi:hypothetical protein